MENTEVTLMPPLIYVGDIAELSYDFKTDAAVTECTEDAALLSTDEVSVLTASISIRSLGNNFTGSKNRITVKLQIIPWQSGTLSVKKIPAGFFKNCPELEAIEIPPFTVQSILEQTGETKLRPMQAPLVVPGTTYVVYSVLVFIVALLAALVIFAFKFEKVKDFFASFFLSHFHSKNFRVHMKQINKIRRTLEDGDDKFFAQRVQHVFRSYLSGKYEKKFFAMTSKEILENADLRETQVEFSGFLRKTDAVRFAGKKFRQNTKENLLENLNDRLNVLDEVSDIMLKIETFVKGEDDVTV
jgi:hypothetical protein